MAELGGSGGVLRHSRGSRAIGADADANVRMAAASIDVDDDKLQDGRSVCINGGNQTAQSWTTAAFVIRTGRRQQRSGLTVWEMIEIIETN